MSNSIDTDREFHKVSALASDCNIKHKQQSSKTTSSSKCKGSAARTWVAVASRQAASWDSHYRFTCNCVLDRINYDLISRVSNSTSRNTDRKHRQMNLTDVSVGANLAVFLQR